MNYGNTWGKDIWKSKEDKDVSKEDSIMLFTIFHKT